MEQKRVKAGHIEFSGAGFKIYKECETDALDMYTRQKSIKYIEEHFFPLGNSCFFRVL